MPRLTNAQVAARARAYKAARAAERKAKLEAEAIRDELLPELVRRGTDQLDLQGEGVVITRKVKVTRRYSIDQLRKIVKRSAWPRLVPATVSGSVVADLVKTDDLTHDQAASCLVGVDESAPYIDVTLAKAS